MTKENEVEAIEEQELDQYSYCSVEGVKIKPGVKVPMFEYEGGQEGHCILMPGIDVYISGVHLNNNSDDIKIVIQQGEGYSLAPLGDVFTAAHGQDEGGPVNLDQYFM
jgi:hypothetical protein